MLEKFSYSVQSHCNLTFVAKNDFKRFCSNQEWISLAVIALCSTSGYIFSLQNRSK
jgi:hypothetical protein